MCGSARTRKIGEVWEGVCYTPEAKNEAKRVLRTINATAERDMLGRRMGELQAELAGLQKRLKQIESSRTREGRP